MGVEAVRSRADAGMLVGIKVGYAGMTAFIVQVGRRDAADQLVERRFGAYCIIRFDVTLSRTRFGNAAQLDEFRTLAVPERLGSSDPVLFQCSRAKIEPLWGAHEL
jgi:hypothetical protein